MTTAALQNNLQYWERQVFEIKREIVIARSKHDHFEERAALESLKHAEASLADARLEVAE